MEASPLTQQNRPDTFEPKIVQLYLYLFNVLANNEAGEDAVPSEGFWRELFLLNPDKKRLHQILEPLTADDLLHMQIQTRTFFRRAIAEVGSGVQPRNENALENLTGFLTAILSKRYTNPSADVIEVLADLNTIDKITSDLVNGLDSIIRLGDRLQFRTKAIETALALVSGAYQTTLVSYLIHRDLFPSLMKYVHDSDENAFQAFVLLGLLANYNKFETQNPYQNRLDDFVNEEVIHKLVHNVGAVCVTIRARYVEVQDDIPEGWTLNSTLAFVGLRALSPEPMIRRKKAPPTEEETKNLLNELPSVEAAISLSTYSFVNANKIFASALASLPANNSSNNNDNNQTNHTNGVDSSETPLSSFLSSTSYMAHNAHRSTRALQYTLLNLLTIRILVEDNLIVKRLSSGDLKSLVRLCRQRPPHLPFISAHRIPATAILDICTDAMSHNLRRRLSVHLYSLVLGIILRLITHLEQTKTRLQHHWTYIWGSLLSLLRFLVQYSSDLSHLRGMREEVCTPLTCLIAHCLSKGDAFLPDPASYDDLFYKLIEAADVVTKFKEIYLVPAAQSTSSSSSSSTAAKMTAATMTTAQQQHPDRLARSVNALITVSTHYHNLLKTQHGKKTHQSPAAIQKVIKDGYETLNLDLGGGDGEFGGWDRWRENSWKSELKRITRMVVEDARGLGSR